MSYLFSDKIHANPYGTAVDAFGRARVSTPLTLFDSYHRYRDNGKISYYTNGSGTNTYDLNSSSIHMTVGTDSGACVYRETSRVFAYQPGKSLLMLITFNFGEPKTNLRNRAGLFDIHNGIFLQRIGNTVSFVRRSYVSGVVVDTVIDQANWNGDRLDGTGASKRVLDTSKVQIFFSDIEWLGVGSVRCGFVIDGEFHLCHTFHHANHITTTYMQTAILPGRVEIENIGTTASSSTQSQICFSIMSEGGYELRGNMVTYSSPLNTPYTFTAANTFYPVFSLRLKSTRMGAIVLPKNINLIGVGNNSKFTWKLVTGNNVTNGSWVSYSDSSHVEYNANATVSSGGTQLVSGMVSVTNQSVGVTELDNSLFKYQLERNTFTNTAYPFTLLVSSDTAGSGIIFTMDWEEL